jgi:hypothetical protein
VQVGPVVADIVKLSRPESSGQFSGLLLAGHVDDAVAGNDVGEKPQMAVNRSRIELVAARGEHERVARGALAPQILKYLIAIRQGRGVHRHPGSDLALEVRATSEQPEGQAHQHRGRRDHQTDERFPEKIRRD